MNGLADLDPAPFPAASRTAHELVVAGIATRRLHAKTARAALDRAADAARHAGIPALTAEVESAGAAEAWLLFALLVGGSLLAALPSLTALRVSASRLLRLG